MKLNIRHFLLLLLLAAVLPGITNAQGVTRVVIDAGHGGKDSGAKGSYSDEKDIVLTVALKTGNLIKKNFKDVDVVYTRSTDRFIELHNRARIANEAKADLFISIHCNGVKSNLPNGAETFVMGLNKSEANLRVAQLENSSILLEDNYVAEYDGFDPRSPEGYIFFSMLQNANLDQSVAFATKVQSNMVNMGNLVNRGVKQAPFLVLYRTTMPSVLVELGFITNREEENYLNSEAGQNTLANSILQAFGDYKANVEKTNRRTLVYEENTASRPPAQPNTNVRVVAPADSKGVTIADNSEDAHDDLLHYRVQFFLSRDRRPNSDPVFRGLDNIGYYYQDGFYKYTLGYETSVDAIEKIRRDAVNKGFKDAFIIGFKNGKRAKIDPRTFKEIR